jgi:hypothetical protein
MKLAKQIAINQIAISQRKCPTCKAATGERCRERGRMWDQGVHKERLR